MFRRRLLFIAAIFAACVPMPFHTAQAAKVGIVAVVNEDMISSLDLEQRMRLALATTGLSDTPEVRQRLQGQILRSLIDERLQLQEAKRQNISVSMEEIDGAITNINRQREMPEGTFETFLKGRGVPLETVREQLRAQIAWSKLVYQKFRNRVRISADEVAREQKRLTIGQDVSEYQISSIVLSVDRPEDDKNVRELAEKLTSEIRQGAIFQALARQFSAGGKDIVEQNQYRWVQMHQLEPSLAKGLANVQVDGVTEPIRTLTGYHILKLHDKRTTNLATAFDSEVVLKQVSMRLKPDAETREAEVLLDIAREVARHPGTCTEKEVAGITDLDDLAFEVAFQRVSFRQLQPQLQAMLANLRVGDVSEPYATPDGIHFVMLCERVEMQADLPPADNVREKLFQDKLELEAIKRLRSLRREAFVEIR